MCVNREVSLKKPHVIELLTKKSHELGSLQRLEVGS